MSQSYLIHYPNGMKRHIKRRDRDLLAGSLTQIGHREYAMPSLSSDMQMTSSPNFLDLELIFDYPPERTYEREQTPRGMIMRLEQMGFITVLELA